MHSITTLTRLNTNLNWHRNNLGILESCIENTLKKISNLELKNTLNSLIGDDIIDLQILHSKIDALNRQLNIKWWALFKSKWLDCGDLNTKYFHRLVSIL